MVSYKSIAPSKKPKKYLGQNFLKCEWAVKKIIETADIVSGDTILEIGPGTGVLTIPLARLAKKIIAIEKDEKLAEELKTNLQKEKISSVEIIAADILKIIPKLPTTHNLQPQTYKVVASIPYYLTSRLLRLLLESKNQPKEIILLIQKEVAERIVAEPSKMNLLALGVKTHGKPEIIGHVPSSCFWPKPKVDSAIIKIGGISSNFFQKNKVNEEQFFKLAKAAFSQKRKTIANSLSKLAESKGEAAKKIEKSGLSPLKRPEELSANDWVKIYKNWL